MYFLVSNVFFSPSVSESMKSLKIYSANLFSFVSVLVQNRPMWIYQNYNLGVNLAILKKCGSKLNSLISDLLYISEIVIQNSLLSQTQSEQNCWFNERSLLVITFLWFSCHFILPLYAIIVDLFIMQKVIYMFTRQWHPTNTICYFR